MPPKDDPVWDEAWRREASHHAGHKNFRPHVRERGANLIGLRGEAAFAKEFGLAVDLSARPGGDGGTDNVLRFIGSDGMPATFPIDCKTSVKPFNLIVETQACLPLTIYVLCKYSEAEDVATLLGWQWGMVLMKSKPRDFGYGLINYWCPARHLRKISELHERRC